MTIIFYNDINFGEGFLQSLCKNDNLGFRNDEVKEKKPMSLLLGFRLLFLFFSKRNRFMLQVFGSRFPNFRIVGVAFIEEVFVYFVILITKEGVKFSTKGDIGTTNIVCKQNTSMDKPEEASIIEMNEPLSNIVIISLSNELSVVVEYKIVKMGYVCFYLAPKIEEDEEDTKPQV
ncbi:Proliferating cell nuclear antigen [Glycine soja]|uniref:Proliferating cell nuclear antigen n=1 Tax=Glycine soja TaxID=3848 RepID=A0A0B2R2A2_GLYSO|nr:Proliferating cell nuclear antigen [Glycine soja]